MSKVYFQNLNSLRFIAAILVVIHHIEQFKKIMHLPNYFDNLIINNLGKIGVNLFFVLSGFLITFLLLTEKNNSDTISVSKFYKRRILRIWPLYFLLIVLSFFVFPQINILQINELSNSIHDNFISKLILFICFLPNLCLGIFPPVLFASQMWSIGYEEQFYLIWPWILKKTKPLKNLMIFLFSSYIILKTMLIFVFKNELIKNNLYDKIILFFDFPSFDSLLVGGFFAYLVFINYRIVHYFYKPIIQVIIYLLLLFFIVFNSYFSLYINQIYSILFGLIIINLSKNNKSIFKLENKIFNYLGQITYSMYMFHSVIIVLVLNTMKTINNKNIFIEYFTILILTVLFSIFSYEFFEKYFINLKNRFK